MLIHVVVNGRQQSQVFLLGDACAKTRRITIAMNVAYEARVPLNAVEIAGVRANNWHELVLQDEDQVLGDAVALAIDRPHDLTWRAGDS